MQVWFEVSAHTGRLHLHLAQDGSQPLGFSTPLDECMHGQLPAAAASSAPAEGCAGDELAAKILRAALAR